MKFRAVFEPEDLPQKMIQSLTVPKYDFAMTGWYLCKSDVKDIERVWNWFDEEAQQGRWKPSEVHFTTTKIDLATAKDLIDCIVLKKRSFETPLSSTDLEAFE